MMKFWRSRYEIMLEWTCGRALSWWNLILLVPVDGLSSFKVRTRGFKQSFRYLTLSTVLPLSKYVRWTTPLDLKNMLNMVLGSNWCLFTTIRGLWPSATQLAFDCLDPIFLWKNHNSSPVTTSYKRHFPSWNLVRFSWQMRSRSWRFCSVSWWVTQREVTFFNFKQSCTMLNMVPRESKVSASISS